MLASVSAKILDAIRSTILYEPRGYKSENLVHSDLVSGYLMILFQLLSLYKIGDGNIIIRGGYGSTCDAVVVI